MQHQHYQLSYFEKLIHVDLKQATSKQKEPDSNFFTFAVSDIISHKNSMLQRFNQYLCDLGKRKQVDWYVSMHQHQLVLLMEEMATCLPEADLTCHQVSLTEVTWLNLYKIIYCNLSELLLFLERKFERYLDIDCRLPSSYLITAKATLFQDIDLLRERFEATAVDKHLLSIVFQPFTDCIKADRTDVSISYRQLYFLKEMKKQLFELLDGRIGDLTERLKKVLHYLNFNSVQYFDYWTEAINTEIENLPTIREKLDRVIYLQKKVNQATIKPGFAYSKLRASLQTQLQSWLAEEVIYQKDKESLEGSSHTSEELGRWKDFKVLTNFSVPQLGNFLRLLMESGFYLNKNRTEVLDFFSHFFTTVKQDSVSPGSLRSNFYKDNAAVSKTVRDILTDLVKFSHKGLCVTAFFTLGISMII
jgi:hypothetical protein